MDDEPFEEDIKQAIETLNDDTVKIELERKRLNNVKNTVHLGDQTEQPMRVENETNSNYIP